MRRGRDDIWPGRGVQADADTESDVIDRFHLARQTLNDADLEREVLGLFVAQALEIGTKLGHADLEGRRHLAHGLVGAARAVGAFALAESAEALEIAPHSAELAANLERQIETVSRAAGELLA